MIETDINIHVRWDNEAQTIIRWDFRAGWTWDEFRASRPLSDALLRSVDHKVDVIFDLNKTMAPPGNAIQQLRAMSGGLETNVGTRLVANGNGFAIAIIRIVMRTLNIGGDRVVFTDSLEEARAWIAERQRQNTAV